MDYPEFVTWPKIPRYENDTIIITEKIDGTNAQILITPDGDIFAGSRTRWVTPEDDNYGFARWVQENKEDLLTLGHGRHYGEWHGLGIQRGYGLREKRFALFNTHRPHDHLPNGVDIVPVLYSGPNSEKAIDITIDSLLSSGSKVTQGYMNVEGVCIYYTQSRRIVKWILNK